MNAIVTTIGVLYRGVNRARRALYRAGVLRGRRLSRPVISVGNIVAGGAGKTPAVIALCQALTGRGLRVAVLTRGYGRHGAGGVVEAADAARYGDEPALIKTRCTNVSVIVDGNRYDAACRYLALESVDVFVLDDGFQHLQLARDVDVVIDVPGRRFAREGRSALADADFVVPRRMQLAIPPALRGVPVFAFAGLADNRQFYAALAEGGVTVAGTRDFPDHHRYTDADLDGVRRAARAAGATALVTTEKDAVKLKAADVTAVPAEFVFDPAVLEAIVARVKT